MHHQATTINVVPIFVPALPRRCIGIEGSGRRELLVTVVVVGIEIGAGDGRSFSVHVDVLLRKQGDPTVTHRRIARASTAASEAGEGAVDAAHFSRSFTPEGSFLVAPVIGLGAGPLAGFLARAAAAASAVATGQSDWGRRTPTMDPREWRSRIRRGQLRQRGSGLRASSWLWRATVEKLRGVVAPAARGRELDMTVKPVAVYGQASWLTPLQSRPF